MALESRELLTEDLKIYSNGLINALKQDKLVEAQEYVSDLRNTIDPISKYLEAQLSYETKPSPDHVEPVDIARTEGDNAMLAAKRADEKAERLQRLAKETQAESRRLRKASRKAGKEAAKARKAAEKAEKGERKIQKEARNISEHAVKANQAARHS